MEDAEKADIIITKCQDQIMRVFPIIDVLNCGGSIPAMMNPLNYMRWARRFTALIFGRQRSTMSLDDLQPGEIISRAEEIEVDDSEDSLENKTKPYYKRSEPPPWGSLRTKDFEARFNEMHRRVNLMSCVIFSLLFSGYLIIIFGETHFYSRLNIAHSKNQHPIINDDMAAVEDYDDDSAWSSHYDALQSFGPMAVLLLWSVLPFALQASALITENMVVPILVVKTVQAHV